MTVRAFLHGEQLHTVVVLCVLSLLLSVVRCPLLRACRRTYNPRNGATQRFQLNSSRSIYMPHAGMLCLDRQRATSPHQSHHAPTSCRLCVCCVLCAVLVQRQCVVLGVDRHGPHRKRGVFFEVRAPPPGPAPFGHNGLAFHPHRCTTCSGFVVHQSTDVVRHKSLNVSVTRF